MTTTTNTSTAQNIATLSAALGVARSELKAKQVEMENYEVSRSEDDYEAYINEVCEEVEVCGYTYEAGYALKNLDPTAFRCGMVDWIDSLDKEDEEDYQELQEQAEELENIIEYLIEKIDALKN